MRMNTGRLAVRRVSVVVPALNQASQLAGQLERVLGQDGDDRLVEVLVADNGSTDGTGQLLEWMSRRHPSLRRVDASARSGPAAARNIGAETAQGDALVFCDADDEVAPGWLSACIAGLENADAAVGSFDFAILNGGAPGPPVEYSTEHFQFLPAGLGANLAVRREAFRAIGGFDEALRAGEDIDFCWRLQLQGYRLVSAPAAVVAKRERLDGRSRRRQQFSYGKHDAQLYRRFRAAGMRRNNRLTVKTWTWLFVNAPLAWVSPVRRATWSRAWFLRLGRLVGSIEHRVFFP
jgi:GT2 family glycosyltransferase